MGFIRGGLLVLVTILIFLSLLAGNIFWTMSSSLEYNNVQREIVSISGDIFQDLNINEKIEEIRPQMELFCQQNQEYTFNYGGQTITISCDALLGDSDNIIKEAVKDLVGTYYYQEYDCKFWNCFNEGTPLFLISEKAHDYWKSKFFWTLTATLILVGIMFLLIEKKTNFPIILGGVIILSAIPITKIGSISSSVLKGLGSLQEYALKLVMLFFSEANKVFFIMIGIGILILLVGIVLKIMKTSIKLMDFFSKFKKNKSQKVKQETPKKIKDKNQKNK